VALAGWHFNAAADGILNMRKTFLSVLLIQKATFIEREGGRGQVQIQQILLARLRIASSEVRM
jgi:hypothetical protein